MITSRPSPNEPKHNTPENVSPVVEDPTHRISRAQLLALAGAGVALAALPNVAGAAGAPARMEFPFYPQVQGTYTPEDIRDILNVLLTMERFAVAVNAGNLTGAIDPKINPVQIINQQASIIKSLALVDFLESLGAQPLTNTYSVGGPAPFTAATLKRAEVTLTIFIGAFMTAAREFAELGQPLLVKWAFQAGAGLAEERSLARALQAVQGISDANPPDNKAFETDLFVYVRDAYTLMTTLGLFGGLPVKLPYPSRDTILSLAGPVAGQVLQKVPNNATVSVTSPADVTKERA